MADAERIAESAPPLSQVIDNVAETYIAELTAAIEAQLQAMSEAMSVPEISSALASGASADVVAGRVADAVAAGALTQATADVFTSLLRTREVIQGQTAEALSDILGIDFAAPDPLAAELARQQGADLVRAIGGDVRDTIREIIAEGAAQGLTIDEQARAIRDLVGLPPNQANAPLRLAEELRAGRYSDALARRLDGPGRRIVEAAQRAGRELTEEEIRAITLGYRDSLIRLRARTIARTETLRASHESQRRTVQAAIEAGHLPPNMRRYWIVTPDDRLSEDHAQIPGLNPNGRAMDEPFQTPKGPMMDPPLRPNCRCDVAYLPPGSELPL